MYLLSDCFIATYEQAATLDITKSPVLAYPTVLGRGVGFYEVFDLYLLIAAPSSREPLFRPDAPPICAGQPNDNPCILRVPTAICDGLASADEAQIEEWAAVLGLEEELGRGRRYNRQACVAAEGHGRSRPASVRHRGLDVHVAVCVSVAADLRGLLDLGGL